MANSVTVWVRLKDPTTEADRMQSQLPGALPLILRMRSSDASIEEDFIFPYSPREINIGKLSDEMVQIPRPGTTPIVAFKSHSLMTLDFTALIAYPGDGLMTSVDRELFALRRMGSSSNRVFQLLNYDIFTNSPFVYRNMSEEKLKGLFFSITEMGIDVTRRNKDNQITMANVKISMVENRNPNINLALIPPLIFWNPVKNCKDPVYAKNHKKQCGENEKGTKFEPASQTSLRIAFNSMDKTQGTIYKCWNVAEDKFYYYKSSNKPRICLSAKPDS